MSNNKKSSVEFILDNLHLKDSLKWAEIIKQAKSMHREEIKEAVESCGYIGGATDEEAEQYYNETFGGNNEQK